MEYMKERVEKYNSLEERKQKCIDVINRSEKYNVEITIYNRLKNEITCDQSKEIKEFIILKLMENIEKYEKEQELI